jgi:hypothetical protein
MIIKMILINREITLVVHPFNVFNNDLEEELREWYWRISGWVHGLGERDDLIQVSDTLLNNSRTLEQLPNVLKFYFPCLWNGNNNTFYATELIIYLTNTYMVFIIC